MQSKLALDNTSDSPSSATPGEAQTASLGDVQSSKANYHIPPLPRDALVSVLVGLVCPWMFLLIFCFSSKKYIAVGGSGFLVRKVSLEG